MTATRIAALTLLLLLPASARAQDIASRTKGKADAPVTVYEMSDFQCPFCREFWKTTFPAVEREYIATGKVKWVFINFPLTQLHPNAVPAAEFAMCAARQGAFWKAHDILYEDQARWQDLADAGPYLAGRIGELAVDRPAMLGCLERSETLGAIRADAEGAARSGARSTPTFYIEGGIMSGAYPIEVFRQVLDSVVAAKRR